MDKCRICLVGNKRALMCIYESNNKNVSYANMMASLANIKIVKHDGITDKICRACHKLLQEAYDLKLLIESSDATLNGKLKKIKFNNINDIKMEFEIDINDKKPIKKYIDVVNFIDGENNICYGDTAISKVRNVEPDGICLKPIPVLEFLKTIQDEADYGNYSDDDDYDGDSYGVDSDDDGEYIPSNKLFNAQQIKSTTRSKTKQNSKLGTKNICATENNNDIDTDYDGAFISPHKLLKKKNYVKKPPQNEYKVCIKPVNLKNLKLIYSAPPRRMKRLSKVREKDITVCPYCGILSKNLKSHILLHAGERKYKCDKCEKAYFQLSGLTAHLKNRHEVKEFKCDECTAAFSTKPSLEKHMVKHRAELKFVCDICNKAFKRINSLRRHRLMHNSANKNVKCDQCNMSFYNKYQLRHHLRIHTGERPYNCEICSQPYSYKRDFNRHCLKKHGVLLKRRSVNVMNEEVLKRERNLMKELVLRVHGVIKDDKPINPFEFEGAQAPQAFESAIEAIQTRQIPIDFQF